MADIQLDTESTPAAPAGSAVLIYVDSTSKVVSAKDSAGFVRGAGISNFSTAAQSPAAATRTYVTGSNLSVPTNKLQVGTCFRWTISITKTGLGSAASTFTIAVGTTADTSATDRISFTKPAGTAAADEGTIVINATVRSIGASGVMVGQFTMTHNLSATGHMVIPCANVNTISAGFDMTIASLIVGLTVTSGASDAITFQLVQAEAWNL